MPNVDGSVHLPTDTPPGARAHIGPTNVRGLVTHASLGEVFYKFYTKPWTTFQSLLFPKSLPSAVAPNGVKPVWVVAINTYSPMAHRNGLTTFTPPKAISAAGVGKVTQRPRGYAMPYVTSWPQNSPSWPTWGESSNSRKG
jgi:hypothetical protein